MKNDNYNISSFKPFYLHPRNEEDMQFPPKYIETEDMMRGRIAASLEAMNEFILDEKVPAISDIYLSRHTKPLFLSTDNQGNASPQRQWGRMTWIQDLGELEYKPSFNHLREIYLHDYNPYLRSEALLSLGKIKDERTLDMIKLEVDKNTFFEGEWQKYLQCISNFESEKAYDLLETIYNEASYLDNGFGLDKVSKIDFEKNKAGSMSIFLEEIVLALTFMDSPNSITFVERIRNENRNNIPLNRKITNALDFFYYKKENKKLILKKEESLQPLIINQEYEVEF